MKRSLYIGLHASNWSHLLKVSIKNDCVFILTSQTSVLLAIKGLHHYHGTVMIIIIMCFCEINSPFLSDCVFSKGHGKTRPGPAEAGGACEKRKGHLGGEKHFILILGGEFHFDSMKRWKAMENNKSTVKQLKALDSIALSRKRWFNNGKQTNCKHCSKWTTLSCWSSCGATRWMMVMIVLMIMII